MVNLDYGKFRVYRKVGAMCNANFGQLLVDFFLKLKKNKSKVLKTTKKRERILWLTFLALGGALYSTNGMSFLDISVMLLNRENSIS